MTILPASVKGGRRNVIGDDIRVDERFAVLDSKYRNVLGAFLRIIAGGEIFREIWRYPRVLVNSQCLRNLLLELYFAARLENLLAKHVCEPLKLHPRIIIYTYWFSWATLAASRLKHRYPNLKVVTRAHRADVYEYAKAGNYMPLGKRYHRHVDMIYAVSNDGKRYLMKQYGIPGGRIRVSRLGVADPGVEARASDAEEVVHLLSVSYAKPVKRLCRLIEGLAVLKREKPNYHVEWCHIGGGPELKRLKDLAGELEIPAVFLGQLPNAEVIAYLKKTTVDVFVNVSASEGVPVSIMEAFSFGIPVVATDVGGTREIVSKETGVLIPQNFTDQDFVQGIIAAKGVGNRAAIRRHYLETCSSSRVFPDFISDLLFNVGFTSSSRTDLV